jgi:hypothetical protein
MKIGQMRYRIGGIDSTSTSTTNAKVGTGTKFTDNAIYHELVPSGETFTKLSIQAPPGTQFFINDPGKTTPFEIGSAGFYNILKDINITNLCFNPHSYTQTAALNTNFQRHYLLLNESLNTLFKLQKKALLEKTYIIVSTKKEDVNYATTSDIDLSFCIDTVDEALFKTGDDTNYYLTNDNVLNATINGNFICFPILQELLWKIEYANDSTKPLQSDVTSSVIRTLFFGNADATETTNSMTNNSWRGKLYSSVNDINYAIALKNLINTYTNLYKYVYNTYYSAGYIVNTESTKVQEDLHDIIIDYLS